MELAAKKRHKPIKIIGNCLFGLIVLALVAYILLSVIAPELSARLFGFQMYTVVTDSMEPGIPVGSLVVSKTLGEGESPQPGEIISFGTTLNGEPATVTHYFREAREENGRIRYMTQGENAPGYDDYAVYRENIQGTYLFHVPFLGKISQFLRSPMALVMLCTDGAILILGWFVMRIVDKKVDGEPPEDSQQDATKALPPQA